jgi:hypothetical protein
MNNITQHLSAYFHGAIWYKMHVLISQDSTRYNNALDIMEEKHIKPMEDFIYSIPYGASDIDDQNVFI